MNIRVSGGSAWGNPTDENLGLQRLTWKPVWRGHLLNRAIHQLVSLSTAQRVPGASGCSSFKRLGSPWQRRHAMKPGLQRSGPPLPSASCFCPLPLLFQDALMITGDTHWERDKAIIRIQGCKSPLPSVSYISFPPRIHCLGLLSTLSHSSF